MENERTLSFEKWSYREGDRLNIPSMQELVELSEKMASLKDSHFEAHLDEECLHIMCSPATMREVKEVIDDYFPLLKNRIVSFEEIVTGQ